MHSRSIGKSTDLNPTLSTCSVPDLKFDFVIINANPPKLEVDTDGGEELLVEFAIHELAKEGGLA